MAKATIKNTNAKATAEVIATAKAPSKADKAREVFAACYAQSPVPQRKDIIAKACDAAGLTPKGAATYLQNFKKAAGLIKRSAPAAA